MSERLPPRAPGPHPTAEQLYAARRGPRTDEAERHLAHTAACALCSEELLRQEAFDAPEPMAAPDLAAAWARFGEPAAVRRTRRPSPLLALAATLAIAVLGLGLWWKLHSPAPDDVTRSGGTVAGVWSPEGTVAAPPKEFRFPDPGGEPRRITVYDATQSYVWTSPPAAGGRVPLPEAERKRLQRGVEYLWTVLGDEGTTPARSFRIRP